MQQCARARVRACARACVCVAYRLRAQIHQLPVVAPRACTGSRAPAHVHVHAPARCALCAVLVTKLMHGRAWCL